MEQGSQWEKAYTHGGDVYRNEKIRMDFSININPLGMPDFIKQAAMDGVEEAPAIRTAGAGGSGGWQPDFTACRRKPLCLETGLRS